MSNQLDEYINKIIVGDSEDVLKNLPDNSIDLVITAPPHNVGVKYDVYNDKVEWNVYFDKLYRIINECIRVLKKGGRIIMSIMPVFSEGVPTHHILSRYLLDKGLIWRGEIIWDKPHSRYSRIVWGSWCSPSSPMLRCCWEAIEVFCKDSIRHEGAVEDIDITSDEYKSFVNSKWVLAVPSGKLLYKHPFVYPEELVYRLIKLFSYKGDIVLDPFVGSGTTAVVAYRLGRRFIGIDISGSYCNIAKKRIRKEFGDLL